MKIFLLLITLGYGYKIFASATKEQGSLKILGRLIGIVMMIAAVGIGASKAAQCVASGYCPSKICGIGHCPMMK